MPSTQAALLQISFHRALFLRKLNTHFFVRVHAAGSTVERPQQPQGVDAAAIAIQRPKTAKLKESTRDMDRNTGTEAMVADEEKWW